MALKLTKNEQVGIRLTKDAPELVALNKAVGINLKKLDLEDIVARVVGCWDASGSERGQFDSGATQAVLNRLAVLALNLDDNGELESWGYADNCRKLPVITLENHRRYIEEIRKPEPFKTEGAKPAKGFWATLFGGGESSSNTYSGYDIIPNLGNGNNEPPVMRAILKDCKDTTNIPSLVIFVTDGGISLGREIQQVLKEAAHYPIFWQFIGIGGSSYGVLEDLDKMEGRVVDNAGFFALDDYKSVSDEELYKRIMSEFPSWIQKVRKLGILKG